MTSRLHIIMIIIFKHTKTYVMGVRTVQGWHGGEGGGNRECQVNVGLSNVCALSNNLPNRMFVRLLFDQATLPRNYSGLIVLDDYIYGGPVEPIQLFSQHNQHICLLLSSYVTYTSYYHRNNVTSDSAIQSAYNIY